MKKIEGFYMLFLERKHTILYKFWVLMTGLASQKETRDAQRNLTGLLLLFCEEWSDWHAFMIIIISHQGYICFSAYTADNYNQSLLLLISCTEVAIRSHEEGPLYSKHPNLAF